MYQEIADRYYSAIEHSKRLYYHEKVSDCNQRQLFQFIDGLFKAKSSSPLPADVSPFELAQRFRVRVIFLVKSLPFIQTLTI